jgi:hypothetical protein
MALVRCTRHGTVFTAIAANACPIKVKSGYPGGWGTPQSAAAETSSAESPLRLSVGQRRVT